MPWMAGCHRKAILTELSYKYFHRWLGSHSDIRSDYSINSIRFLKFLFFKRCSLKKTIWWIRTMGQLNSFLSTRCTLIHNYDLFIDSHTYMHWCMTTEIFESVLFLNFMVRWTFEQEFSFALWNFVIKNAFIWTWNWNNETLNKNLRILFIFSTIKRLNIERIQ